MGADILGIYPRFSIFPFSTAEGETFPYLPVAVVGVVKRNFRSPMEIEPAV